MSSTFGGILTVCARRSSAGESTVVSVCESADAAPGSSARSPVLRLCPTEFSTSAEVSVDETCALPKQIKSQLSCNLDLGTVFVLLPVGEGKSSISHCFHMFCVHLRCLSGFRLLGEPALPHDIAGRRRGNLSKLGRLTCSGRSACLSQNMLTC